PKCCIRFQRANTAARARADGAEAQPSREADSPSAENRPDPRLVSNAPRESPGAIPCESCQRAAGGPPPTSPPPPCFPPPPPPPGCQDSRPVLGQEPLQHLELEPSKVRLPVKGEDFRELHASLGFDQPVQLEKR